MNINSFNIDTTTMPSVETFREFTVTGEIGAEFQLVVISNPASSSTHTSYYDFETNSFEVGHNNMDNNLTITLTSSLYRNNIFFPSGVGDYVIKLIALNGTTIKNSNIAVLSRQISKQASATTITFQAESANSNNYETFPTTDFTGALGDSAYVSTDWDITNKANDSHGFGLRELSPPKFKFFLDPGKRSFVGSQHGIDRAWYFKKTQTVDGAITSKTKVKLDSLTNIAKGMIITGVSSGSLSGEPIIIDIDTENKIIKLSSAQTFADGITLTFRATGSKAIYHATGARLDFAGMEILATGLTKTIRAGSSGTTINLNGTYGISGGNVVKIFGLGIDNSAANAVSTVSASSTGGSIVVQNSQSGLTTGSTIYFGGCFRVINFKSKGKIVNFPDTNMTVYFDIDKFLAVGTDGS
tara:strand:+ start:10134 stop:11372 length:1239 start_codon:yes stop_codon:yes gene_type:complete